MEGETDLDDLHEDKIEIYRIIKYKYIFFYNTFLIFFLLGAGGQILN